MRLTAWLALAALSVWLGACYDTARCPEERCNGIDDDCDGRVDETFVDDRGVYHTAAHCGACGVVCDATLPSAAETECVVDAEAQEARCAIVRCPEGHRLAGDGACVPVQTALCMPCVDDADCALRDPEARCLRLDGGERRCGMPCAATCPPGFDCRMSSEGGDGQCVPTSGVCACSSATPDVAFACTLESPDGNRCAGARRCEPDGLGPCEAVADELCNEADDDCDALVDEGFVDDTGRYVHPLHCGACGAPCAAPGPHMQAECVVSGGAPTCEVSCEPGFVDVDRIAASGCECELQRVTGIPVVGGDADCDGVADDSTDYIFVSPAGNDASNGSLSAPVRSIGRGLELGAAEGKTVLVARGLYRGAVSLRAGVSLYGGYSPDFRERDLALYPVVLEGDPSQPGMPVLRAEGITTTTRVDGLTLMGSRAIEAGAGSTALYADRSGPELTLSSLTIFAGRGADGALGVGSSGRLAELGVPSLEALAGDPGEDGRTGGTGDAACTPQSGGAGGRKQCGGVVVHGGDGGNSACADSGCTNGAPCGNAGCADFTSGGVCDFDAVLAAALPNPAPGPGRGLDPGAAGEPTYDAVTSRQVCRFCEDNPSLPRLGDDGGDGAAGLHGAGGAGCAARLPAFDAVSGILAGVGGGGGGSGVHGSGGGGGSAGAGYEVIGGTEPACQSVAGGTGGGGGSGGCGAPGATGGGGGGSSVGVLVRLADGMAQGPTFQDVRVVTDSGGAGGAGGIGASGGPGGAGGLGGVGAFWCARNGGRGGDGGRGGAGGGGGGGCGGDSFGVVIAGIDDATDYVDTVQQGTDVELAGVAGQGGEGGFSPGVPGSTGRDGRTGAIAIW